MKTKHQREVRVRVAPQKIEVRKNADGSQTIAGQAVVYGALSQDLGGFVERIAPGAFSHSLRDDDQLCLYGHDDRAILGRRSSGTLTLTDTPSALEFSCILPNTQDGQTVAELCRRGDLQGMSFGFTVSDDTWQDDGTQIVRTVNEATLFEISVVGQPAYSQSSVSLRSCPTALRDKLSTKRDDEDEEDNPACDPESPDFDPDRDCPEDRDNDDDCDPEVDGDCDCEDDDDCEDDRRHDVLRIRTLFGHRMAI
jgi:hypothetical protein